MEGVRNSLKAAKTTFMDSLNEVLGGESSDLYFGEPEAKAARPKTFTHIR
ncbi:hypothetical protein [Simkania sp.]